jgi:hypothetical protein
MNTELSNIGELGVDTFKKFTLLNINNRLGHDVRDKVLPVSCCAESLKSTLTMHR